MGWITDPKKALYNKEYIKTCRGYLVSCKGKFRKGHVRMPVSTKKTQSKVRIAPGIITKPGENTDVKRIKYFSLPPFE
jgi:hypothetical protein